jgi:spore germination cell wall hydrolase CwlJ-like protein
MRKQIQVKTKRDFLMFKILQYKVHILAADLRRNSSFYWISRYASDVTFFAMLGLPFVALGFIFHFAYVDQIRIAAEQQRHADLTCLARNVYFEARGESITGQLAVAEVTLNRVKSKRFPDTVCGVVHEKRWDAIRKRDVGAFSWTEFDQLSKPEGDPWERATHVAVAAYDEQESHMVPGALFYHAKRISPRWSRSKELVAEIGRHIFYE